MEYGYVQTLCLGVFPARQVVLIFAFPYLWPDVRNTSISSTNYTRLSFGQQGAQLPPSISAETPNQQRQSYVIESRASSSRSSPAASLSKLQRPVFSLSRTYRRLFTLQCHPDNRLLLLHGGCLLAAPRRGAGLPTSQGPKAHSIEAQVLASFALR